MLITKNDFEKKRIAYFLQVVNATHVGSLSYRPLPHRYKPLKPGSGVSMSSLLEVGRIRRKSDDPTKSARIVPGNFSERRVT